MNFKDLQTEYETLIAQCDKKNVQDDDFSYIGEILIYKHGFECKNEMLFRVVAKYLRRCLSKQLTGIKSRCTKGLFIHGDIGVGKTLACSIIAKECQYIFGNIIEFNKENHDDFVNAVSANDIFGTPNEAIFDDVGTEPEVIKNFGTSLELFQSIVEIRYRIWKETSKVSIFTSNLSATEIKTRYGERTFDRLQEMCFWVEISGESLRDKQ